MRVQPVVQGDRDEQGSVAVMVGFMAVVLLSVAALAVDLGAAYVQKQAIQKRADFAALAGAVEDNLPMAAAGATCGYGRAALAADQAIIDTAAYLSETPGGTTVLPGDLVDCDLTDGEAGYGTFRSDSACVDGVCLTANQNQLSVISQPRNVKFGMARVMGFDDVDVQGQATVEIKTPLQSTLPFYAFQPCDYGLQTIVHPVNGKSAEAINLYAQGAHGSGNTARLTTLTTNPASSPAQVPLNVADPDDSLVISGVTGTLVNVTQVGFFLSGGTSPGPAPEVVNAPNFTLSGDQITIPDLPTAVTSVEAVWYVRVKKGPVGEDNWSPVFTGPIGNPDLRALPLTVGTPSLTCKQGSTGGNFGTLELPPTPTPVGVNGNTEPVAYNIIKGLSHGLAAYPPSQHTADFLCTSNPPGTKTWPQDGTNCVGSEASVDKNAAEWGFLTGFDTYTPGLLGDTDSDRFCPFNYPSGTTHVTTFRSININNDVLSCYFTNDSVTVSQVSSSTYSLTEPVIDQSIYRSPRFVSVPVFGVAANKGESARYQIIGFRPAFVTEQTGSETRVTGTPVDTYSGNTGSVNGIAYDAGKFNSLTLIFLNEQALPNPPLDENGKYIPYVGTGHKVPLLVN